LKSSRLRLRANHIKIMPEMHVPHIIGHLIGIKNVKSVF
jgi:hypothetical protein